MSYILDALKKADSERQHGKAPDIYSQSINHNALDTDESFWRNPMLWFFLAVVTFLLVAALLFINWKNNVPVAVTSPPVQTITPPAAAAPAPIPSAPPDPVVTPATIAAPAVTTPPVAAVIDPAPVAAPPAEPVEVNAKAETKPTPQVKKEKRRAETTTSATASAKKPATKRTVDPAVETISTTLRDLPLNIQNEIPTITVGGYIYSANKAESQLLINKMVLREGDQIVPGMILESMMPHSAILNYKGYRYRIAY